MGLAELTSGKKWKAFMAKLYGFGASVVIIGALFKIQHWPGAGIMLTMGLSTEAIIFFFSAFEPPHAEPDWTLVYPELAGLSDEEDTHSRDKKKRGSVTEELDKMLEDAKIGPELLESLGVGLRTLSDNTKEIGKISTGILPMDNYVKTIEDASKSMTNLSGATDKYAGTINNASEQVNGLNTTYKQAAETINQSSAKINESAENIKKSSEEVKQNLGTTKLYAEGMQAATQSINNLKETYIKTSENLVKSSEAINFADVDGKAYGEQIQKLSKNLSALNAVYELQLKDIKEQVTFTEKVSEGLNVFLNNITNTVEDTNKFKDNISKLNKNISALNTVYGNMLTAMNVKINA